MSHRLFLLRHAEASNAAEDYDRPLTEKGRNDARMLAENMTKSKMMPDYILCSPAKRTIETCSIIMESLPEADIIYPDNLYEATKGDLFTSIQKSPNDCKSILIVGHNPSIQSTTLFLTSDSEYKNEINHALFRYRPCTLSVISCQIDKWEELQPGANSLETIMVSQ